MRRNSWYVLEEMGGRFFLYPYGQKASDFARDVEINEVGAFIWKCLEDIHDEEEIVKACLNEYECNPKDYERVRTAVELFVDDMKNKGLLEEESNDTEEVIRKYEIAGIDLIIAGGDEISIPQLDRYVKKGDVPKKKITITLSEVDEKAPKCYKKAEEEAKLFIDNNDLCICDIGFAYEVLFKSYKYVTGMLMSKDGAECRINYMRGVNDELAEELFQSLRMPFYLYAQSLGMLALHSASVIYKNVGWLFSGKSKAGKSTHANLWKELGGAKVFNGDVNLLGLEDGLLFMYGIPWCGTSNINETGRFRVKGITFIKQGDNSKVVELSYSEKVIKMMRRSFSPNWCEKHADKNAIMCENIVNAVEVCELICTNNREAFDVMHEYVEECIGFKGL